AAVREALPDNPASPGLSCSGVIVYCEKTGSCARSGEDSTKPDSRKATSTTHRELLTQQSMRKPGDSAPLDCIHAILRHYATWANFIVTAFWINVGNGQKILSKTAIQECA